MNAGSLPLVGDRVEELRRRGRVRLLAVERHVIEADAGGLGGGRFAVDVGIRLGRLAQVDDRREPELLDLRHRLDFGRAGARDGRLETREVGDAGDVFLGDLLRHGRGLPSIPSQAALS